jgi:PTH2 family peptidyl-tRNA hydrolase
MANNEPKQVIVVRKDLNMRKGKIAAQASHASLGAILNYGGKIYEGTLNLTIENNAVKEWLEGRFTKVCVSVDSEEELLDIYQQAIDNGVNVKLIKDAGLTEFGGVPTYTCLAIGPDYPEHIDPITGHLKLL